MNSTEVHASDCTDAEKQHTITDSTKRNTESSGRQHVNVLLDLSEEDCCREHSIHLLQNRTGWEDAVEGWGRFPPFGVFLQPPRKGKKNKQDIIDSHCLLCADLNLSDLPIYCSAGNAMKTFRKTAPNLLDLAEETDSSSSDELYSLSLSLQNMSEPLISKLLSGDEQYTQKSPSVFHYHTEPCQILKENTVALSIRSFSVLPPVKESRNLRNYSLFKRVEPTDFHPAEVVTKAMMPDATGAVTAGERLSVDGDPGNVFKALADFIPEENGYRLKGSPCTKHWLSQENNHLPSIFNITFQNKISKYDLPSSTESNSLPQAFYALGRNLRQEELTRPSTRSNISYRLYSSHKARDLRRPEAHRLMLIGTRFHMPM
ncbi:uncharacterized protein si:ch73-103b9.2 [Onychostoma macrolepis]|uniref:Uncharacterized protein n=1 Tax=Onychostoma macrolepis TaxID=369639 RepID=A0A7J6C3N4_9TELE|nr:uncharacterized protein si:ch73-103b9.2 [Onychostoma macrolepis]XP_058607566.1 uncharacterized protein si:ch73-103b9.2 [Onychostoma macrolepis]XP_058607567.1 uncharacterized protein si:ch73-103b9.2 [Onychostoma macrolepis]XP_058607568.1 uncharacterized protein si:ch73-103b9.2 [Onychostoma macrolepis]XP_058607569.1 uncharacterized protein si:ch73-103b9.2 [Onychostoma macrolepis]XP_058607570.1 uncharacterized protein si:ch73-103b9.2 [Onychostoma macrolepis]XP_058607571.1 uncharacterized prot